MTAITRFSGHVVTRPLDVRPRPRGGDWVVHRTLDGRAAYIAWPAFLVIRRTERAHAPIETGGLLFGRCFQDAEGPYVLVTSAEPPAPGEVDGTVSTVRITAAGTEAMTARAHERDPLADVVGWFHTHPRFDAFFSDVDRHEQAQWASPLAVGFVVAGDAVRREPHAVYLGPNADETFTVDPGRDVRPDPARLRAAEDEHPHEPVLEPREPEPRIVPVEPRPAREAAPLRWTRRGELALVVLAVTAVVCVFVVVAWALALQRDDTPSVVRPVATETVGAKFTPIPAGTAGSGPRVPGP